MRFSAVITGASGFIGSTLVKRLARDSDIEVVPVCRSRIDIPHVGVKDYGDTPEGNVLVHLAEASDRGGVNRAGEAYRKATGAVMDKLLAKNFDKIIYCSSSTVYGDLNALPCAEDCEVFAVDNYTRAKLENETRVLEANGIVVRLSNVIGPAMSPYNVISDILKQLPLDGPITVRNDIPVRDFVWIDDVADG